MAKIRVRARAVDMLGRQQIAGIPTAIHELFKNAHDAYAKRVEVDFFREDRLLILRDDGHGMTREELEDRWLTLGTETKINANHEDADWPEFLGFPRRPVTGEKGIGRLAIAVIGPQALVVTRAVKETGLTNPAICLVNWRLFEVPGLDLDEVEVPVMEIKQGTYPKGSDVQKLVGKIKDNLDNLGAKLPDKYKKKILDDLQYTSFDPGEFLDYLKSTEEES